MGRIAYTVTATIPTAATAREYLEWLRTGHLAQVLAGGALAAEVVKYPDEERTAGESTGEVVIEVRYTFATPGSFRAYEQDHAPQLRAEGLKKWGNEAGIRFERRLGSIVD